MFNQGETTTIATKTILYKVLDSSNPYYKGKFFRLISRKSHSDDVNICFFRNREDDEFYYSFFMKTTEVTEFFEKNNISYELDQEYGRKQIEYLKHKIEMLKINYKLSDPVLSEASSLSIHPMEFKNTYEFQLECDHMLEFEVTPLKQRMLSIKHCGRIPANE